jgi:hypothetical protein
MRRGPIPMKANSLGIFDDGSSKTKVILRLFELGNSIDKIAKATGFSESIVRKTLEKAGKKTA